MLGTLIFKSLLNVLVNSVKPFSLVSTTINSEGLNFNIVLIKEDPMVPAPPITKTDFPLISSFNVSWLFLKSISKKLFSLLVTNCLINSEILGKYGTAVDTAQIKADKEQTRYPQESPAQAVLGGRF